MAGPYSTKTTWCRERPRSISTCRSVAPSQAASGRCQGRSMKSGCPSRTWIATRPAMALSYTDLARTSNPVSAPEASSAGLGREMRYSIGAVRSGPAIGFLLLACGSTPTPLVPATREAAASAEWWNGAVVYEVFVRSFLDSNGDGKGDLAGLISKLDYLNDGDPSTTADLGVDAIWLMPIYPSPSYHGYDVTDYDGVNPDYGTPADMDSLIAECHKRGIKVILDYVPNHTSIQHPWFSDASRRDWYVWSTANPGWTQPWSSSATWFPSGAAWYYAVFWSGMPDLNWKTAAVRAEMGAAAGRWLARGSAHFRAHCRHGGGRGVGRYSHHRDVFRLHCDRPWWRRAAAALQLPARGVRGERRGGELGPDHRGHARLGGPDVRSRDRGRSEERRVGKECRSRWSPYH